MAVVVAITVATVLVGRVKIVGGLAVLGGTACTGVRANTVSTGNRVGNRLPQTLESLPPCLTVS